MLWVSTTFVCRSKKNSHTFSLKRKKSMVNVLKFYTAKILMAGANSADSDQTASEGKNCLIRVYTVYLSAKYFKKLHNMQKFGKKSME